MKLCLHFDIGERVMFCMPAHLLKGSGPKVIHTIIPCLTH